jgi:hypothetical protein
VHNEVMNRIKVYTGNDVGFLMPENKQGFRLLSSWKEVAGYLGRGIRTVQRWEKMGLPVRRIGHGQRAPVIADARAIDRWLQTAKSRGFEQAAPESLLSVQGKLHQSIERSYSLQLQMLALHESQQDSMQRLVLNIRALQRSCEAGADSPQAIT